MDPESKKLLQDTFELAQDNNKMLHHIRRSQKIASFVRAFYWIVIIGASIWSFYWLQPYVDKVVNLYNSISVTGQKLNKASSVLNNDGSVNFQDLIKKITN